MPDTESIALDPDQSAPGPEANPRPGAEAALYTNEEVIAHFEGLFPSIDIKQEIAELGCGLNSLFNKNRSLTEFTAMSMALWKLALDKSFPTESENILAAFLASSPLLGEGKKREKLVSRVGIYRDLFALKKTGDFTPISQYMAENLCKDSADRKVLHLKLSLAIRKLYQIIFDHLI